MSGESSCWKGLKPLKKLLHTVQQKLHFRIYSRVHVKSPNGLNPTLSEFNEIWHTCWFQPPNLKSKIFQWSDDRFPRYGGLIFSKFWENKGGHPTSKHQIFWTSGPIWKSKVSLTRGKKPGILIWHHFCDLGKFWGDKLSTYILTLRLTPWMKL